MSEREKDPIGNDVKSLIRLLTSPIRSATEINRQMDREEERKYGVKLMRFLTKETWKAPPTAEAHALMPAEIAKVKELTEQGLIEAVYVAADIASAWIVWNVDSEAALEEAHNTLPVHPYMNSEIMSVLSEEM